MFNRLLTRCVKQELIAFFGDLSKSIDIPTFDQILQMDDDSEREFSRTLVFEFLEQAEDTFKNLQDSLCVLPAPSLRAAAIKRQEAEILRVLRPLMS